MNTFESTFYNVKNLDLYTQGNIFIVIFSVFIWLAILYGVKIVLTYIAGAITLYRERREEQKKQNTLNELILMKDVQSELDKEIEQATLKATFQE